ncbi:hypothetical protein FDN13_06270 [Caloramator sp. E03]|uniref:polysaccharide biosynthesis tyrosine autokinase n=1 Tax=Caloramator sp. E03 TaxID=2576307 RepID=UPI00111011C6|nr:polysaccharide biosynthesis tyrosine autokinase [Caloramator sp. E03]QCX33344.1 hypothetical protein FDN13_06270 [Caloramator sp. E03]
MDEENVIDLRDIINILKKRKWIIVYASTLTVTATLIISLFFINPKYESKASIVIVKEDARIFYEDRYTQSDILMYQKLLKTYCEIAKSNLVIDKTAEEFPQYKSEEIKKMVSAVPMVDTQIIELKAKCNSPSLAQNIVNTYAKNFIEESMKVLPAGDLKLLDSGKYMDKIVSPNYKLNLSIAFVIGIMMSVGIIFLLEYIDTKIKSKEQIEREIKLPVLVEISNSKSMSILNFCENLFFSERFFELESFKLLKNTLQYSKDLKEKKSFLISSIKEGEGKTTIALNLAVNLSLEGKKTLLMDFNMLHPSISSLFNIAEDEKQLFEKTQLDNLYVFSISTIKSANRKEILYSRLEEIFDLAYKNFDYIIVDTPSAAHLSYIQDISRFTDGCIFVIKEGLVDMKEFLNTKEILERTSVNIVGTVLNKEINLKYTRENAFKRKNFNLYTKQFRKGEYICQGKAR